MAENIEMPEEVASDPVQAAVWGQLTARRTFAQEDAPTLALLCYWHAVANQAREAMAQQSEGAAGRLRLSMPLSFANDSTRAKSSFGSRPVFSRSICATSMPSGGVSALSRNVLC